MLPCQKCGYNNELGRIFCHQCGQKLDLDAIRPASRGGKSLKPKGKNLAVKWIRRAVEMMVLLVLLYAVHLLLEVVPEPAKPSETETVAADKKWLALEKLVGRRQPSQVEISPAEAKAFLAALKAKKTDVKWGFVPERIWIEFAAGSVDLQMLATMRMGGALEKKVYLTYSGVPKIQNGQLVFEAKAGSMGRLNWPIGVVNTLGFHRYIFADVLGRLTTERETLSQLSRIEVHPDRVIVYHQPR